MSISRARFIKGLGNSMVGWMAGTGVATAAQALAKRMAENEPEPVKEPAPRPPIPFITNGPEEGKRIALTFDDGPTPDVTDVILDELKKRNIPATFFMIGEKLMEAPDLGRRVPAEGHELGNHTFLHLKLSTLQDWEVESEIERTQETMDDILKQRPIWFRPPYGTLRQDQAHHAADRHMKVVLWNVDPRDWSQPGEAKIVDAVLAQTKPGAIILCHDLYPQTANCIGDILDGLVAKEFEFVNLSSLLKPAVV